MAKRMTVVLGIDEAGRGPWAGPLVVGAVVLGGIKIEGLTDSKKLTKKRREVIYDEIVDKAAAFSTGWVSAKELDEIGMSQALRLATIRAVKNIKCSYSEIIIDGTVNFLADTGKGKYVTTMAKADLLVPSVSAASIIAKVERDRYMNMLDEIYPEYNFGSNAGYGTAKHRAAIDEYGICSEHRLSFTPLKKYSNIKPKDIAPPPKLSTKTTKQIGDEAEQAIAQLLTERGHKIIARNWRKRYCEIDIVSVKGDTIYFTEVKYRRNDKYGNGFDAIGAKKQQQIKFAAEVFLAHNPKFRQCNVGLLAASVVGGVSELVELE